MNTLKTSGEDDLGAIFYQWFWHIMGKEVANYCIEILNGGTISLKSTRHKLF